MSAVQATPEQVKAAEAAAAKARADADAAARAFVVADRPWWQLALGVGAAAVAGGLVYKMLSPDGKTPVKTLGQIAREIAEAEPERAPAYSGFGRFLDDVAPVKPPKALNRAPRKKKCAPELPEELPEDAELVDAVDEVPA